MIELAYNGSYVPLKGVKMTEAYASTLEHLVRHRGGLLMRQIHHWSALFFIAAISVHLCGSSSPERSASRVRSTGDRCRTADLALLAGFAGTPARRPAVRVRA